MLVSESIGCMIGNRHGGGCNAKIALLHLVAIEQINSLNQTQHHMLNINIYTRGMRQLGWVFFDGEPDH